MPRRIAILVVSVLFLRIPYARGVVNGYEALSDWLSLPCAKTGVQAGLASSYDRSGGNDDFNYYEWPIGPQTEDVAPVTVTTLEGPGIITRFWMPHATADEAFDVRMTIDGALLIDTDSDTLLGGDYGYFGGPLVSTLTGGQVCYEPIVFAESLVIESNNWGTQEPWAKDHHYYQYSYHKLAAGTEVAGYSGVLTGQQQSARDGAVQMINTVGENPAGASPGAVVIGRSAENIAPGEALTLGALSGTGMIRRLNVAMAGATDAELESLRLRVRYDGAEENAIDVPVAHFFGAGGERADYESLPLGAAGDEGFYCYWPMPYRDGAVVELYNASASPVEVDATALEYEAMPLGPDMGTFRAVHNEETTTAGQEYHEFLDVQGAGHYVGNLLYLQQASTSRLILEGDDIILVDGVDLLLGTGLEDAYNSGYYYNHVLEQSDDGDVADPESGIGPYHGLLHMDDVDHGDDFLRTDQYRWLIGDFVPFTESLQVKIENYGKQGGVLFGSTAFYYSVPTLGELADLNGDGAVWLGDLSVLAGNWNQSGRTWAQGDINGDGRASLGDLAVMAGQWGWSQTTGAPLPEPASALLWAVTSVAALGGRKRRWVKHCRPKGV